MMKRRTKRRDRHRRAHTTTTTTTRRKRGEGNREREREREKGEDTKKFFKVKMKKKCRLSFFENCRQSWTFDLFILVYFTSTFYLFLFCFVFIFSSYIYNHLSYFRFSAFNFDAKILCLIFLLPVIFFDAFNIYIMSIGCDFESVFMLEDLLIWLYRN